MEEVDSILISQLRDIGCDLDNEIIGISSLDSFQIMQCVAICLQRISNDSNLLESIPDASSMTPNMNMSIKYKLANQLSTCLKKIGYKSDIGYQTFLYSNEHEIRRLLLFLVEQISTDEKTIHESPSSGWTGSKNILQKLKNTKINTIWIPHSTYHEDDIEDDIKYSSDSDYFDSYSTKINQNAVYSNFSIQSYLSKKLPAPDLKYYQYKLSNNSNNNVPILPETFIDTLEWNNHFLKENHSNEFETDYNIDFFSSYLKLCENKQINPISYKSENIPLSSSTINSAAIEQIKLRDNLNNLTINDQSPTAKNEEEIRENNLNILRNQLQEYNEQLNKLIMNQNDLVKYEQEYQEKCKLFEASYKTKENLENGITTIKSSIKEISSTWEQMQKELMEKLKAKKIENMTQNEEHLAKVKMLNTLKKSIAQKLKEIQSKEYLITELESKIPQQWPPGRGSYTRRIMEIIQNVKKQNDETKKVLLETKSLQKDINNLNGKIERSFMVAEEVLFREAKQNEWNRNCYKSLALLQSTFTELLKGITDIGEHLRQIRQLEEMIESENSEKTSLTRINADLEQIRLENKELREKLKAAGLAN